MMAFRRSPTPLAAPVGVAAAPTAAPSADLATNGATPTAEPAITRDWPSDPAGLLGEVLRSHALPESLVDRLVGCAMAPAHAPRAVDRLAIALAAHFHFLPLEDVLQAPVFLYGPPNAGISCLAAKLAARFEPHEILVVSTDPRGEATQLAEHLEVLDLPLAVAPDAASLRSTVATADGRMVIVDGGGCSPAEPSGAKHIGALIDAARAQGMLVLPADTEPDAAGALARAAGGLDTHRMIATKFDAARYLGSALLAADAGGLALVAASVTPHFAFGVRGLTPENLARRLMSSAMRAERWRVVPL
jgi:flagellar biosynthesis protein FlhF